MKILKNIILFLKTINWKFKSFIISFLWAKVWKNLRYNSTIIDQSSLANIEFWDNVWIWKWNVLNWLNGIKFGNNILISDYCALISTDHKYDNLDIPISEQWYTIWEEQKIIIEDGVWIWFNVIITKWVKIWKNAIVGAWAVVTKDVPENAIVWWVPAKIISYR